MGDNYSKIFDIIAPIYAKFYDFQVKYYDETITKVKDTRDITQYKTDTDKDFKFSDKSFDIVMSFYVAHGLKKIKELIYIKKL